MLALAIEEYPRKRRIQNEKTTNPCRSTHTHTHTHTHTSDILIDKNEIAGAVISKINCKKSRLF